MNAIVKGKDPEWYKKKLYEREQKIKKDIAKANKWLSQPVLDTLAEDALPAKKVRKSYSKDPYKDRYYKLVWEITNAQDLKSLPNSHKRGWRDYHLDHIMPISYGFKNGILPCHIGDISNLRFIPWKQTYIKRDSLLL